MTDSKEFGFKITVIGDGGVGKTSLIKKFTKGTFERDYIKTIGAQFSRYDKVINGDVNNLIFWDIAGQDDFNFLHNLFYKYSKSKLKSENVCRYKKQFNSYKEFSASAMTVSTIINTTL